MGVGEIRTRPESLWFVPAWVVCTLGSHHKLVRLAPEFFDQSQRLTKVAVGIPLAAFGWSSPMSGRTRLRLFFFLRNPECFQCKQNRYDRLFYNQSKFHFQVLLCTKRWRFLGVSFDSFLIFKTQKNAPDNWVTIWTGPVSGFLPATKSRAQFFDLFFELLDSNSCFCAEAQGVRLFFEWNSGCLCCERSLSLRPFLHKQWHKFGWRGKFQSF